MIKPINRRLGWVLVLTSAAYFMVALDATVVASIDGRGRAATTWVEYGRPGDVRVATVHVAAASGRPAWVPW